MSLHHLSVHEILSGLRRGEFSSREVTQACLEQIERREPDLHAFITRTPELALQMADAADRKRAEARAAGQPVPPLLGLPLAFSFFIRAARAPARKEPSCSLLT